jgi:hypothetical protein
VPEILSTGRQWVISESQEGVSEESRSQNLTANGHEMNVGKCDITSPSSPTVLVVLDSGAEAPFQSGDCS